MDKSSMPVVVFIGGNGSNLQAMIDYASPHWHIAAVISHRPDAFGLTRAKGANLETAMVDHKAFDSRLDFEQALLTTINAYSPKLIVLAGFMRILSAEFINACPCPILNIHPALLPHYRGLDTHRRVLAAKEKVHGTSVHFVNAELDGGPVIAEAQLSINAEDSVETLKARIQTLEHQLYPLVMDWFALNRLHYKNNHAVLDGIPLGPTGILANSLLTEGSVN